MIITNSLNWILSTFMYHSCPHFLAALLLFHNLAPPCNLENLFHAIDVGATIYRYSPKKFQHQQYAPRYSSNSLFSCSILTFPCLFMALHSTPITCACILESVEFDCEAIGALLLPLGKASEKNGKILGNLGGWSRIPKPYVKFWWLLFLALKTWLSWPKLTFGFLNVPRGVGRGPVLKIEFGPLHADFGSVWSPPKIWFDFDDRGRGPPV